MNLGSCILKLLVTCVLSSSGLPSISSKIKVRGTIRKNGQKVVRGVEGKDLKIVCNLKSGIPGIKFFMNINGLELKRVGSGRLKYSFIPSKRDNMKPFVCSANSPLLDNPLSRKVLFDIQYSPIVTIIQEVTEKKLTLICNPSGNPKNYTFADWEHYSAFYEHIRNVQGTSDGTLTFLDSNNNNKLHENDGIYKCKTSNGIYGTNGNLYQKGLTLINDKVPPVFVNANHPIQFGHYRQKMNLTVLLYNSYGALLTTISKQNEILNAHGRQAMIRTHDIFHGVNVTVSGIKVTFQLTLMQIEDFTDYTIKACNEKGCNGFTVKVKSNVDRPEHPTNVSVIPYIRYLAVSWDPGYNGGVSQAFFIEYHQEADEIWRRSGPINDNIQARMSYILYNKRPKTRYFVRMLSKNEIGESNKTSITPVITLADRPEPPTNVSVIPYERHLAVSWCPEYNGGEPQTFFIEYQQEAVEMWTRSGPIIDNTKGRMSNLLYNMSPKRRYFVRVFSRNEIGESNKTAVTPVMTLEPTINIYRVKAVFVVLLIVIAVVLSKDVFVVALLVLAVTLAIYGLITFFFLRRKEKNASDNYNPGDEEVRENFQVEPVDNQLYLSSDDPDLATVHNLRTQSVMNTSLPSNAHDNQTYQIQLHNEDGANGRRPCTYINTGVVSSVHNRQMCETSLNYTEITFDEAPTMHDAAIHGTCGSVNRTIYSEIDLMADPVAPLSSSESECDESN